MTTTIYCSVPAAADVKHVIKQVGIIFFTISLTITVNLQV